MSSDGRSRRFATVVVTSGGARGENIGTRFESNRRNFALTFAKWRFRDKYFPFEIVNTQIRPFAFDFLLANQSELARNERRGQRQKRLLPNYKPEETNVKKALFVSQQDPVIEGWWQKFLFAIYSF